MARISFFLIFYSTLIVFGQDSSLSFLKKKIEFDIAGSGLWHSKLPGSQKAIALPTYLKVKRKAYNNLFNKDWNYAEDNPLFHAAYQMSANSAIHVGKGLSVYASLIAEHRGFSYGINSTSNVLIFPQLKIAVDRKLKIGKRFLHIFGSVGNQINPRLYEGLTIYNLYQQGHNYRFRYGKFQLQYTQLNDLLNGIGLYIDETYDIIPSLEGIKLSKKWKLDIRTGFSYMPFFDTPNRSFTNLSAGVYIPDALRLYSQISYRLDSNQFQSKSNYAYVIGIKYKKKTTRTRFTGTFEGRYYGGGFNMGFIDNRVLYRKTGKTTNYANTVGEHFYPLLLFDRPFSQWAVYTEYQDSVSHNVMGLCLNLDFRFKLHEEITLLQQYDFNYISASNGSSFIYPFYNVGLAWEPAEGNYISVSMTNKGMNLDMHYNTHYLYKHPTFMFRLQRDLRANWFNGQEEE
jgi:hypothetical protein